MKRFINRASAVAALVAITGLLSTVDASVLVVESVSREVYYGDLNLNSDAGVATLHGRIRQAAEQVCGDKVARLRLEEAMWQKQCRMQAIADAVATVNVQKLSQLHAKKLLVTAAR
jgi:UrcA family protein